MIGIESIALRHPLPCEPFGEFDDGAPIGGIGERRWEARGDDAAR